MKTISRGMMRFRRYGHKGARQLRSEGDDGMRRRDWPKAVQFYQSYLKHCPNDSKILVQLGHALKELNQLEVAKATYSKAVEAAPDDGDARFYLEGLLQSMEQHKELVDITQPAILDQKISKSSAKNASHRPTKATHRFIADMARSEENWHEAAIHYSQHLKEFTDDAAIWVQLGHMLKEASFADEAILLHHR